MDTAVIAGIFSLTGVIIGAVLTIGTQIYLEKKREDRTVQQAARLVIADLMWAEITGQICTKEKKWWVKDRRLTTEGWQKYREVLAPKISWDNWVTLSKSIEAVGHLQGARDGAVRLQLAKMASDTAMGDVLAAAKRLDLDIVDPAPPIPKDTVEQLKPMLKDIIAGRVALAPLAQDRKSV